MFNFIISLVIGQTSHRIAGLNLEHGKKRSRWCIRFGRICASFSYRIDVRPLSAVRKRLRKVEQNDDEAEITLVLLKPLFSGNFWPFLEKTMYQQPHASSIFVTIHMDEKTISRLGDDVPGSTKKKMIFTVVVGMHWQKLWSESGFTYKIMLDDFHLKNKTRLGTVIHCLGAHLSILKTSSLAQFAITLDFLKMMNPKVIESRTTMSVISHIDQYNSKYLNYVDKEIQHFAMLTSRKRQSIPYLSCAKCMCDDRTPRKDSRLKCAFFKLTTLFVNRICVSLMAYNAVCQ